MRDLLTGDWETSIVLAQVVHRATVPPTCGVSAKATQDYGVPEQILTDDGKMLDNIEDAQARVDACVKTYYFEHRHQGTGDAVPNERFRLAGEDHSPEPHGETAGTSTIRKAKRERDQRLHQPTVTRKVDSSGGVSFTGTRAHHG